MSSSHRKSNKYLYLVSAISIVLALGFVYFRSYLNPTPAPIFAITPLSLEYGNTVISGTIRKDTSKESKGNYVLVLSDSGVVVLDSQNIDSLVGQRVSVQGLLVPPELSNPGYMVVNQIIPEASP